MTYIRRSSFNKNNNLLRFRKGQKDNDIPLLKSNQKYVKLGLLSGGTFLSIVGLVTLFLLFQYFYFRNVRKNLEPFAIQHDNLVQAINLKKVELSEIGELNKNLINSIISIKSGSSIISEISKLIPKSIVLKEISVKDNNLEIKGIADHIDGLEVINLFMLELNNSLFLKKESVKLIQASKEDNAKKEGNNFLTFLLKAKIIEDVSNVNKIYLKEIGSYGLFKRIDKIKKRGLI